MSDEAGSLRWIDVCASAQLLERGDGVRFEWADAADAPRGQVPRCTSAFVVRFEGRPRAFLNRCAHRLVELDWTPGRFFDDAGLYLVCSMHGALYRADAGLCVAGPCVGAELTALNCEERDGRVRVAVPSAQPRVRNHP